MSETPAAAPLVLLVDDDPLLRLLAVAALGGAGFDVIEAAGGREGEDAFAKKTPDLVLLDLVMPDEDGYAVCKKIRSLPAGASIPIVVMTGLDDAPSIDRAYEVGATDFVTKPINYGLLVHRLRYLLRAAAAFRESRASSRRLGRAQQLARLAQWELDLETHRFRWSEEAHTIFRLPATSTEHGPSALLHLVHPDDRRRVETAIRSGRAHQIEYRMVLPSGAERVVRQDAEVVEDGETGARLLSGAAQDVTELRRAEHRVRDLAFFDPLTSLPNRTFLRSYLTHALGEAKRQGVMLAMLSLDLDGFKRVNDTLGHAAGDALLKEVASRIAACIDMTRDPSADPTVTAVERHLAASSIAARLGGDEFAIVLSNVASRDEAAAVARRVVERLSSVYSVGNTEVFSSSSVGIACFPETGQDADALLERADAAMYQAKEAGRNQYQFFTADVQGKARRRLALENALRVSLARSGIHPLCAEASTNEFRLEFQPKVAVPSGEVVGVEALLRWTSPELGAVSPAEFIPVAEEAGLIVALGSWVLRSACQQAKAWADEGEERALRVAVNVSSRQFRDPALASVVEGALTSSGLEPSLLELEITEGLLMQDTMASDAVLGDLKCLGVRIALDDFGTGYSSLGYLTRLPIDTIKIDRAFVKDVDKDERSATLTSAIIGLSRGLSLEIVVEGVETQAQLDFFERHGSMKIQGYFFGRPMTPQTLETWRSDRAAGMGPVPATKRAAAA